MEREKSGGGRTSGDGGIARGGAQEIHRRGVGCKLARLGGALAENQTQSPDGLPTARNPAEQEVILADVASRQRRRAARPFGRRAAGASRMVTAAPLAPEIWLPNGGNRCQTNC